ncbi:MAG: outer membrane protein assembly factor BamB family protein [Candidatus Tyrphobacter sp.]
MRATSVLLVVAFSFGLTSCGGGGGGGIVPSAPRATAPPASADWNTFADGLAREGYNPSERTLGRSNVASLHVAWTRDLGGAIDAQSLFAANVTVGGSSHDMLYVGTEGGTFYALDASTGATLWQAALGSVAGICEADLPGGDYGITGTATFDRTTNRVYVADGLDRLHAFDMASGQEAAGWPVAITALTSQEHVYSALAYNPANHLLYAQTAGYCDITPYQGRLIAVDTQSASVVATFLPGGTENGGGLWGMGGPSIDATTGDLFIGTGNTIGATAHDAYAEQVVRLTSTLSVEAANYPGLVNGTRDYDFGSTPMLYQMPACAPQFTAQNKDGSLYVYGQGTVSSGPMQNLEMADDSEQGQFIGVAAFSPVTNEVYVGVPAGYGGFSNGLVALRERAGCSLALAWQSTEGSVPPEGDNVAATVANGVVYSVNGIGDAVFANDAQTGAALWNSASAIGGPVFTPPTVANGRVYVGSWDHSLYAFAAP